LVEIVDLSFERTIEIECMRLAARKGTRDRDVRVGRLGQQIFTSGPRLDEVDV